MQEQEAEQEEALLLQAQLPHVLLRDPGQQQPQGPSAWGSDEDEDSDASDSSATTSQPAASAQGSAARQRQRQGSIASTYWRPERRDRSDQLSMIDERCASAAQGSAAPAATQSLRFFAAAAAPAAGEAAGAEADCSSCCRFEQLALQYDSDEIGELEEDDEEMQDGENFPASSRLLQQLLARQQDQDPAQQRQQPYEAAADVRQGEGPDAAEAAAAIAKVQSLCRMRAGVVRCLAQVHRQSQANRKLAGLVHCTLKTAATGGPDSTHKLLLAGTGGAASCRRGRACCRALGRAGLGARAATRALGLRVGAQRPVQPGQPPWQHCRGQPQVRACVQPLAVALSASQASHQQTLVCRAQAAQEQDRAVGQDGVAQGRPEQGPSRARRCCLWCQQGPWPAASAAQAQGREHGGQAQAQGRRQARQGRPTG